MTCRERQLVSGATRAARKHSNGWLTSSRQTICAAETKRASTAAEAPPQTVRAEASPLRTVSAEQRREDGRSPGRGLGSSTPAQPPVTVPELVVVGVIRQPHGVRGEMKVQPLTDFPEDRLASPGIRLVNAWIPNDQMSVMASYKADSVGRIVQQPQCLAYEHICLEARCLWSSAAVPCTLLSTLHAL